MKTALVATLAFVLAACSQAPQNNAGNAPASGGTAAAAASTATPAPPAPAATTPAPAADATSMLTQYHWQLTDAVNASSQRIEALFARPAKPLQLDFADKNVSIENTCNRMHGSYSVAGGKLTIGNLASTLMACNNPSLQALDAAAGKYLQGTFVLTLDARGKQPRLDLSAAGNRLTFTGTPTAETRYGGPGETMFLEVAPQTRPCNHPLMPNAQCLYVRELHYDARGLRAGQPGPWHVLAQNIEGYSHRPGVRNVLRVKQYAVKNPPADGSSVAYVLDMVVESHAPQH